MNIKKDDLKRIIEQAFRAGMNYGYGVDHENIHEDEDNFWKQYSEKLELFKPKKTSKPLNNNPQINLNKRKRLSFEVSTCGCCEHWQGNSEMWIGYCPILKEKTESDESCNDFEDIKE